jgi:copper chaperone CopZ
MDDPCREILPLVKQPDLAEQDQQSTVYLGIDGLNCGNCANRVRNSLLTTYGVTAVTIDQPQGLGEVRYNPSLTNVEVLVRSVAAAGGDGHHNYSAVVLSMD